MKQHRFFCILALSFILSIPVSAQSYGINSNEDFGRQLFIYLDSENYPMTELDRELLRVKYEFRLALEEIPTIGTAITSYIDGQMKTIYRDPVQNTEVVSQYILQIGRNYSKFVNEQRAQSDSVLFAGGSIYAAARFLTEKANPVFAQDCYYHRLKDHMMEFTGRLAADDFLYEEFLPTISWNIGKETKQICGYSCRLAEGAFRGRNYQVWFTETIPVTAGPWKLSGLPGLILEVEDTENKVKIVAKNVLTGQGSIYKTEYPYMKVSRKQYKKLSDQFCSDPDLFAFNHTSRSGWILSLPEDRRPLPLPRYAILEQE